MSSSITTDRTKHEIASKCNERKIMPADLFMAATKGKRDFFVRHLGLPAGEQNHTEVTVEAYDPNIDQTQEENKIIQYNLDCATSSGETILHILVDNRHNELAKKVFQKYTSLLKAQDNQLQTPLHYAAKVGNMEIIQSLTQLAPAVVEDAIKVTDDNMDTALHLAAKHGHKNVVGELMKLNREMVYKVNKEILSPLHVAIVEDQTLVVEYMLQVENSLAFTQFSDGMFPIHAAASRGNIKLVEHLLQKYTDSAELRDLRGRNLFHIAAEENKIELFGAVMMRLDRMHLRMLKAKDNDGNTPLHSAAMKGWEIVSIIRQRLCRNSPREPNNKGLTPFQLSQIKKNDTIKNRWVRTQLIGLGAVLIATVAFAAAFTFPGGYNADIGSGKDHGTPMLGRKFMFRAFTIANALAFIQAFLTVFVLVPLGARDRLRDVDLELAINMFLSAANCMVLSFGTGSYVILAPINMPLAIIILVPTLFCASPAVNIMYGMIITLIHILRTTSIGGIGALVGYLLVWYVLPFGCIFGLAFLK